MVTGDTGSGKTTQAPQYILAQALKTVEEGADVNIICTQPRRIGAVTVAQRVAYEHGCMVGSFVGYSIQGTRAASRDTRLLYCTSGASPALCLQLRHTLVSTCMCARTMRMFTGMLHWQALQHTVSESLACHGGSTHRWAAHGAPVSRSRGAQLDTWGGAGVLLRRLAMQPDLAGVSHIVIDEIHERGLHEDLLLAVIRDLLQQRPELKLILMSATLNAGAFLRYFPGAGVVHMGGRSYPVATQYLEDILEESGMSVPRVRACDQLARRALRMLIEYL